MSLYLLFDWLTREWLFNYSIPHLQYFAERRSKKWTKIANILSDLADKYGIILVIGCSYQLLDMPKSFLISLTVAMFTATLSILKSAYHEARPFFVEDLTPTKCWLEYGNPSGHAIGSVACYLSLWDMFCR
jgi:membrane-associated phospholipid phosphatase